MNNTAWAHLPNAKHIDAVLADVRKRPEAWLDAEMSAGFSMLHNAWEACVTAASGRGMKGTLEDALLEVTDIFEDTDHSQDVWNVVTDIVGVLGVWDSSADLLECTPDVLRAMIDLAEPPVCHQAALLLPYAIVRSNAKQEVT